MRKKLLASFAFICLFAITNLASSDSFAKGDDADVADSIANASDPDCTGLCKTYNHRRAWTLEADPETKAAWGTGAEIDPKTGKPVKAGEGAD